MKSFRVLLPMLLVTAVGCDQSSSKLDGVTANGASAPASGSVEERLARLEANWAKHAEALDFLNKVYAQQKAQQEAQKREEHDPNAMFAVDIARDIAAGKIDGPATAPVTIVKAFDFACPYCQRTASIMDDLVKEYDGKVRVVYMDLVVHPQSATKAHLAACAAAKQGKYKDYKNAVWEKAFLPYAQTRDVSHMGEENLLKIAKDVGLNADKLKTDMNGQECQQLIAADMAELQKFKVNGTPGFFINGKFIGGALPKEGFKQIVDEQLKIAEQSGAGASYYDQVVMAKGVKQFKSAAD
jgi:protein-disulfide isomerase